MLLVPHLNDENESHNNFTVCANVYIKCIWRLSILDVAFTR